MILFDRLSREKEVMAQHILAGQSALLGSDALLADLSGQRPVFRCMAPGQVFCVPPSGSWYAISTRRFSMRLGLRDLAPYRLEQFEDRTFFLGFVSSMELQVAHVQGFQRWIRGRECMTCMTLYADLYEMMRSVAAEAVRRVLPTEPSYEDCIASKRRMEEEIGGRFFRMLLGQGLYMAPETYRIERFAKPHITI